MLTKQVDFARLKWTYQHEQLLQGQWGWSSKNRVFNQYIVFHENHKCTFKDALNTTVHETRSCSWGIEKTTAQLTLNLDDKWKDGGFANPDAWKPVGGAANKNATLIAKAEHPPINALFFGSWGWSTDGKNVNAHLLLHPEDKCEFRDHNNKTVTGDNANPKHIPWCTWKIN